MSHLTERVESKETQREAEKIDSLTNRCPITRTRVTWKKVVFTIFSIPFRFTFKFDARSSILLFFLVVISGLQSGNSIDFFCVLRVDAVVD